MAAEECPRGLRDLEHLDLHAVGHACRSADDDAGVEPRAGSLPRGSAEIGRSFRSVPEGAQLRPPARASSRR